MLSARNGDEAWLVSGAARRLLTSNEFCPKFRKERPMTLRTRKHFLLVSLAMAVVCLLPNLAAAQQVTYYDFDGVSPSYTCTSSSSGGSLFCFNNSDPTASLGNPALLPNSS